MVDSKAAGQAVWAAFSTRDPERIRAVLADDVTWIAPSPNATQLALGGTLPMSGADRIVHFLTREFPALFVSDVAIDLRGLYADGSMVISETRMRATLVNGRHYENDYCFIFEMVGSRVRVIREYMDTQRGYRMMFGDDEPAALV